MATKMLLKVQNKIFYSSSGCDWQNIYQITYTTVPICIFNFVIHIIPVKDIHIVVPDLTAPGKILRFTGTLKVFCNGLTFVIPALFTRTLNSSGRKE